MSSTTTSINHVYNHGAGAYGRDGAPAPNFMSSPARAHRHPSPQRPNIAPSERPIPPIDRFSPRSSAGAGSPPAYANPFASPYDPRLCPPKAAFLEAASISDHSFDSRCSYGLVHGDTEKFHSKEDFYTPTARLDDLKQSRGDEESSPWLKKQSQAGSKFKGATWVAAIVSLIVIAGLVAKIVTTKSPPLASPTPLKWANGASSVPTFGANASANQPQPLKTKSDLPTSNSLTTSKRKKRSLKSLD